MSVNDAGSVEKIIRMTSLAQPYGFGFTIMRAQHFTNGHALLVGKMLSVSRRGLVLIGSAQASGTEKNPFDADFRQYLIEQSLSNYRDRLIIGQIADEPDLTLKQWGSYLLKTVRRELRDLNVDLMIYGLDPEDIRTEWFDQAEVVGLDQLVVSRNLVNISATKMREYLVKNDFNSWRQFASPEIWHLYPEIRSRLCAVPYYAEQAEVLGEFKPQIIWDHEEK